MEKNIALSVNLNKVALIRNSREGNTPNVFEFGKLCLEEGADGLTVHPRPDQRHIRPSDVVELAQLVKDHNQTHGLNTEFNIEGNPFAEERGTYPGLIKLAEQTLPDQCTLVPDNDAQLTSDHGFDLTKDFNDLAPLVEKLKSMGIRVSLFMDPIPEQIELVKKLGADRIELYTGPFAWSFEQTPEKGMEVFEQHCKAATYASELGLGVNAGHDLNLKNMILYRDLPNLQEVSIGHALTVDALLMGFKQVIKSYLAVCK